ncbi:MAG: Fic family protein [Nitrospinae bacterium]|nr:Fic family protein [Nitrospinota bacterium]
MEGHPIQIPDTVYSYDTSQGEKLLEIEHRVKDFRVRAGGALTPEALVIIRKYFKIKNIYHSNAIEGNVLNVGETELVVRQGLTLTGKPLKDQAEAKNLSCAVDFLEELAKKKNNPITIHDLRQIHSLVLKGIDNENAGNYRQVAVKISGSSYTPPSIEQLPGMMDDLGKWLSKVSSEEGSPSESNLVNAIAAHAWFVYIHPFIDGNGRVGRLLMNLLLMRSGFPIAIITKEDRLRYYDALEQSQASDLSPLIALVCECVEESLEEYERAGEEQRERQEWAKSIADRFTQDEKLKAQNKYEIWKSAMDLLKSYFRQTAEMVNSEAKLGLGRVVYKDFGVLEFEKYVSLSQGESAKRTWFFGIEFRSGERRARYLFFFGYPSSTLNDQCDVTIHLAREEGSRYARLDEISHPNVPQLREIGYKPSEEKFLTRLPNNTVHSGKIETFGMQFFEEVAKMHFGQ